MPWALLVRLATRLALLGLVGRGMRRRTPVYQTPGQPGRGADGGRGAATAERTRHLLSTAAEISRIAVRAAATMAFAAATGVLGAAGITLTSTGPRWVGVPLLLLAAVCAVVTAIELRVLVRLRMAMYRRTRMAVLSREAEGH